MSPERRAQRKRERALAVAAPLSIYAAIIFFLTRPSPVPAFTDTDFGQGVSVTLVGMSAGNSDQSSPNPMEQLAKEIAQSPLTDQSTATPSPSRSHPSLADLFGDAKRSSEALPGPAGGGSPNAVRRGLVGDPGAQISGGRRNTTVGPDGQIAACWRQTNPRVPVRVAIILDHQGGLIGAPEIVRPRGITMDDQRRAQEAIAMRAMAGCAPFSLASAAGTYRSFELDFGKDRDWIRSTGPVEVR